MAYRSDVEALQARHDALQAEVIEKSRARDEAAHLLCEARARAAVEVHVADLAAGGPPRRLRRRLALGAAIVVLAAVGGLGYRASVAPGPPDLDEVYAVLGGFTDRMCACKDTACAQHVSDDLTRWSIEMAKRDPKPPRMSEEATRRFTQIGERLGKCMQSAMSPAPQQ